MEKSKRTFEPEIKKAIAGATAIAVNAKVGFVDVSHLLQSVLRNKECLASRVLVSLGVNLQELGSRLAEIEIKGGENSEYSIAQVPINDKSNRVLKVCFLEAKALKSDNIWNEHLLLSILRNKELSSTKLLKEFEVEYNIYKAELEYLYDESSISRTEIGEDEEERKVRSDRGTSRTKSFLGKFTMISELEVVVDDYSRGPVKSLSQKEEQKVKVMLLQKQPSNIFLVDKMVANCNFLLRDLSVAIQKDDRFYYFSKNTFYSLRERVLKKESTNSLSVAKEYKEICEFLNDNKGFLVINFHQNFQGILPEKKESELGGSKKHLTDLVQNLFLDRKTKILILGDQNIVDVFKENYPGFDQRAKVIYVNELSIGGVQLAEIRKFVLEYEAEHRVSYSDDALMKAVQLHKEFFPEDKYRNELRSIFDELGATIGLKHTAIPKFIEDIEEDILSIKEEKNKAVKNQQYEKAADLRDQESKLEFKLEKAQLSWREELETRRFPVEEEDLLYAFADRVNMTLEELMKREMGGADVVESNDEEVGDTSTNTSNVSIKGVPLVLLTTLKQYIFYFTDYLRDVKNVEMDLSIQVADDELNINFHLSEDQDFQMINEWLAEYMNFFRASNFTEEVVFENGAKEEEIKVDQLASQVEHLKKQVAFIETREKSNYFLEAYIPKVSIKIKNYNPHLLSHDFSCVDDFKMFLRNLVSRAELEKATKELESLFLSGGHGESDEFRSLLSLQSRMSIIKQKESIGTISEQEASVEMNKITFGVIQVISNL